MLREGFKTFKFIKEFKKFKQAESDIVRKRALIYLKDILKTEGGILTKLLQYSGTNPDEIEEINELSQQVLEGISVEDIKSILFENFQDNSKSLLNISDYAIAASVGQVHFAELNGNKVAIKIQYPQIKKTFIEQLKLLKVLPSVVEVSSLKKWGIDISMYQKKLELLIEQECNYLQEATQLKKWKQYLSDIPNCNVPFVYDDFSNEIILTQSCVEGELVNEVKNWSQSEKTQIAKTLIQAYFETLLKYRVIQGDTNHGNFIFKRKNCEVYFIDLGQVISLSENFVQAILYLIECKLNNTKYCSYSFFVGLGFDREKLKALNSKLDLVVEIIFEPLFADYAFDLADWNYKRDLDLLLGEDKWWFRSAGGTEFFLFMKSFMGIKNLVAKLKVKLFYKQILKDIIDVNKINNNEFKVLEYDDSIVNSYSEKIKILILEEGSEKVKLTIPFMAIFELETYFNDDVKDKIKEKNIDINTIVRKSLEDGGKPKEFFHLEYGTKVISISME